MMQDLRRKNLEILRIHVEDAGFLLVQRDLALEAPNYRLIDIYDLEQRLFGHLDAIVHAKDAGAQCALEHAKETGNGEAVGVLMHVALRQRRQDLIELGFALLPEHEMFERSLPHIAMALSLASPRTLAAVIRDWIESQDSCLRWIALEICRTHRIDPRTHLVRCLEDDNEAVRDCAVRAAGDVGRNDCLDRVLAQGSLAAVVSGVLLGDSDRASRLGDVANFPKAAREARRFAEILPLALSVNAARDAVRALVAATETIRWGIVAMGAMGSAEALPWLQSSMSNPETARVAVSAFERITGIYFAHEKLEMDEFPDDPDDPIVDACPTETMIETNTPWPDPKLVDGWMADHIELFPKGERLLFGLAAWTFDGMPEPWVKYQSRWRAIAHSLAIARPGLAVPNWRAPVHLHNGVFTRQWLP